MSDERIGLHNLSPAPGSRRPRKRVGRGEGSGTGKTSGRGQKGAGSRSGSKQRANFEGGQMPIHMRMRKLRGPHMKKSMPFEPFRTHTQPVNVSSLEERFDAGTEVTVELMKANGLATRKDIPVKVLAKGEITKPMTVHAHRFSAGARERIEAAGGTCALVEFSRTRVASATRETVPQRITSPPVELEASEDMKTMTLNEAVRDIIRDVRPDLEGPALEAATEATLLYVRQEDLDMSDAGKDAAAQAIAAAVDRASGKPQTG